MASVIFTVVISIGLPFIALLYAIYKKRYIPFGLGILAFVVSQVLLRIPLMQYMGQNSASYSLFSITQPVLFAIIIGLSAGVFEELARFVAMKFLMQQRDWQSGFLFGAGHGGIEAVLFVGISAISLLFSPSIIASSELYLVGGIERLFAMLLHIGLSIIVLQGVVQKRFLYVVIAILIHGLVDALVGIFPIYIPADYALIAIEGALALIALAVFIYSLRIKRRGVLE